MKKIILFFSIFPLNAINNLIEHISVTKNTITITPNATFKADYLNDNFFVTYEDNSIDLSKFNQSIITIPFILSTIAMVWHSEKTWHIQDMDEDLFYSLEKIKLIFKLFYPHETWSGELVPSNLIRAHLEYPPMADVSRDATPFDTSAIAKATADTQGERTVGVLFSGGLDAICASLTHYDKNQVLITIGGNDVPLHKKNMWHNVKKQTQQFATTFGKNNVAIVSNFFSFIKKNNHIINPPLKRWWWYYTLQSLSYSGLTAPLLYMHKCTQLFIGSSFIKNYPLPWGTHPLLDNNIAFCGVTVHHENADLTRCDKIKVLQNFSKKHKTAVPTLRVCWDNEKFGGNCCKCEKCLRTINNIIAQLGNPKDFGFKTDPKQAFEQTKKFINKKMAFIKEFDLSYVIDWENIQHYMQKNFNKAPEHYKNYFKWFMNFNFKKLLSNKTQSFDKLWKFHEKLWELGMQGSTEKTILLSYVS